MPIGALEPHLRRGLGDARFSHRRLTTRLAREFAHASVVCFVRRFVLGSQDATPLEFRVGVREGGRLHLDDLVVTKTPLDAARR